jgi:hypothetical protein
LEKARMTEEFKVLKSSEIQIQGLHGDEQKKCATLAQQLADVSAQLTSWEEALKEVQNELQLQKERSDMFLLATILNQIARPPKQPVPDLSMFDMTEDLPTTNISAEEEVMTIEPSTTCCGVEASGKQVQAADSGNCALQRIAAMAEHDEEEDDELSASDWEGVTVEDFDRLYRLLRS